MRREERLDIINNNDADGGGSNPAAAATAARTPTIFVAVPHRRIFFDEFVIGLVGMLATKPVDVIMDFLWTSTTPLDVSRNIMVSKFLALGRDYLFFLDDDIVLPQDSILRLVNSRVHIVSGLYFGRGAPHDAVATFRGQYIAKEEFEAGELLEVDQVGCGCLLVHKSVFHEMGKNLKWRCMTDHTALGTPVVTFTYEQAVASSFLCPYCGETVFASFFEHRTGKADAPPIGSEDFVFCVRAKEAGYPIYLNAAVKCGHLTIAKITENGITTPVKRGDKTS